MPSAASRHCSVCNSVPSKYNCANCNPISSTCSLKCSSEHKSTKHPSTSTSSPSLSSNPSASISTLSSSSNSSSPSTSAYVPINAYDSNQFQQDFNYLNQVGRYVTDLGKDLLNKRMIPQELLNPGNSNNSHGGKDGKGNHKVNVVGGGGAAQHKRETLRKQLHFRGLKVLLLPEGMEMRKKNGTNWLHKESKMIYTLEVRFPLSIFNSTSNLSSLNQTQDPSASTDSPSLSTRSSNTSKVILLNRQSGDSLVERIVLAELERRSSEEMKNGGSLKGGSISTDSVENENGISETTEEKTERIKEAQGVESVGTGNGNGIENSTTTKPPGTKLSKREKKRLKKEANATNPDANQSNATSSSSNSKGKSKDSKKAQDSRLQDPDFEPSFKVSEKLWKGVGIEVQLQSNGDEIYQTLPSTSKLLLPIFESRLRNETSLKYLDWFERQKTKEGREGIGGQSYGDGNGLEGGWSNSSATGKGKGREMNSNNIPLGNRTSIPAPPSNSHPSNSHASTSIPHYDGPPPGFYTGPPPGFGNAQNSRPHLYSGPPPSTLSQLPDRPRPQFSSPPQTTSSAFQSQSESDPTSSSSPIKTNPLVSSSLLNKLSGIIPGGNRSRENSRSQTNEELKSLGVGIEGASWEDLEKLEKSSKAETLFESLEKSKSSSNIDGASTSNPISSSKNQSTNSKHPRRPRILLSLKSTDSLEHALKNLPEGFEVVEYACLELWSTEKVEEMKVRGEIVIMELGMGLGDQELVVKESRSTTAEGFSDLKNGNGRKRSESESQNPVQEEKDIKRQRINSEPSKMKSTKFAIGIRSSPVKEVATSSLGTLVGGYGSDSDEEEEAEVSTEKIQSMVAKSELLTGEEEEDQVMKEVEEEEEEENWGTGLAGMARAFGIAPQAEKNEKSELAKEGAGEMMGGGGLEEGGEAKGEWDQTVILKIESQGDEELDWGEE